MSGQLNETTDTLNNVSFDANGNMLIKGQLIELGIATGEAPTVLSYHEDTQADFSTGTLTNAEATTDGKLKNASGGGTTNSSFIPYDPSGVYYTSRYGFAFEVLEPISFYSFVANINLASVTSGSGKNQTTTIQAEDITFSVYNNYVEGTVMTGKTPYLTHVHRATVIGNQVVTPNWTLPVGKYWATIEGTVTGIYRSTSWGGTHPMYSSDNKVRSIGSYFYDGSSVGFQYQYFYFNITLQSSSVVSGGTRISPTIDIGTITNYQGSKIEWTGTGDLTIDIKDSTSSTWYNCTNGGSLPLSYINGQDLTGRTLQLRENLNTNGVLENLTITFYGDAPTVEQQTFYLDGVNFYSTGVKEGVVL